MEIGVGDGDPVSTVGNVKETIKIILSAAQVTREIAVVDPDVGGLIDTDSIAVAGIDLADLEVSDNNVLLATDVDANTGDGWDECEYNISQSGSGNKNSQLPFSPIMVLSEVGRTRSLPVSLPETMIVRGSVRLAAAMNSATVLTVTVSPPAPPVVPPFCVQYPTLQATWA